MDYNSINLVGNAADFDKTELLKKRAKPVNVKSPYDSLKKAIWIYFYLLIFEGALRKWFLPFLATPLLLVRDPIAIWALIKAYRVGLMPKSIYIPISIAVGVITIFTAILFGHGNVFVAIYGSRTFLYYIPFIFLIGRIFTSDDVIQLGRVTLWISIPMTILIALQFYSPQSAWVNKGVGGDEAGAGFSGALGFFRPPGTFSFTNGIALFYPFLSCFVFYFWLHIKKINKLLLIAATMGLIASIPFSISRTLLFSVLVVALFVLIATARKPKYLGKMIGASIGLVLLLAVLSNLSFIQTATEAFTTRFNSASDQEGGVQGTLGDRYLGQVTNIDAFSRTPAFGYGSGMLTNVGTKLLSGQLVGGISEGETARLVGELGPILGLIVLIVRTGISIKSFRAAYNKLTKDEILPWIILSFSLILGPQSNWSQPTSLGFSILCIGLVFASLNTKRKKSNPAF